MVVRVNDMFRRRAARWLAAPMFCLSLTFLIVVAILVVLWVDVQLFLSDPDVEQGAAAELSQSRDPWISQKAAHEAGSLCLYFLVLIYPLFWLELLFQYIIRDRSVSFWQQRSQSVVACFCPPLRMCARNYDMDGNIWFPKIGWRQPDKQLRDELEKKFSVPMIFIALAILPVLLIEVGMREQLMQRPWLQLLLHASMGVIWFAFAAEFLVMVSVAEKKLWYCKEHWLDLAIILLPFIAFLRSLRVVRATRLARLAKIQQLSKMGRLYRLRGLAMRALRALLILELLNRIFRISPERRLKSLRSSLEEKEAECEELRGQIAELEQQVQREKKQEMAEHSV
jgi:voltage-gated potassium channel